MRCRQVLDSTFCKTELAQLALSTGCGLTTRFQVGGHLCPMKASRLFLLDEAAQQDMENVKP